MRCKISLLCLPLLLLAACDLDPKLFNTQSVESYDTPNTIVPDSARTAVTFSSGGNTLYGFYVRAPRRDSAASKYTILYFHGNKHNMNPYWERVEYFYQAGFSVLIFDYEGFGKSGGTCSQNALIADSRAALAYTQQVLHIPQDSIIYYGYSLGGYPAIHLAAEQKPARLIIESAFASGEALVQSGTLLDIPGAFVLEGDFNNAENITNVTCPVAFIHGEEDSFIDISQGKKLFANCVTSKVFFPVPGANHTDVPPKMGLPVYYQWLQKAAKWQF